MPVRAQGSTQEQGGSPEQGGVPVLCAAIVPLTGVLLCAIIVLKGGVVCDKEYDKKKCVS